MRKLLTLAAATLLAYGAAAQTTQGRLALTGAAGYSSSSGSSDREVNGRTSSDKGSSYTLSPSIGYFIKDNLEIGAGMRYEKHKSEWTSPSDFNFTHSTLERKRDELRIFARQYKYLTERLALQTTLAGGIGTATQQLSNEYSNPYYTSNYSRYYDRVRTVSLSPGIAFFPSDRLALSANLGALQYEHKATHNSNWQKHQGTPIVDRDIHENKYKTNSFGLDFSSWNLNFGLSLFIGK
jgi:hypothetical protein